MESLSAQCLEQRRNRLFGPVLSVAVLAGALLLIVSLYLINRFDVDSRLGEQVMVAQGLDQRVAEFEAQIVPQINWDDAVAHLDNRLDPDWADQNLSAYLHSLGGVDRLFVVGSEGQLLYSGRAGARGKAQDFEAYRPLARELLREIRQKERQRSPYRPSPDFKRMLSRPIQATSMVIVDGLPHIVIATLVQPDFGTALPAGDRAPVVIAVLPLRPAVLDSFGSRYGIENIRPLLNIQAATRSGRMATEAIIPLRDSRGKTICWLTWTPRQPGTALLRKMLLPTGLALLVLGCAVGLLARRSSAMASDLIASEARARHLAYHDTLTQLPNRALMFDRLRQMLALSRRFGSQGAVHCIDLDRFKEVNDTLGHHAGDELIQEVAKRLCTVCRASDTVARLGGDEFVIIQPGAGGTAASHLAQRLLEAFKPSFELEYGTVQIGCSIGVTVIGNPDIEPTEALRQADLALYRSKESGRSQATFFELEMDAALKMRRSLDNDLRVALARGALSMVYQPQVDHRGQISGLEALVRWHHPQRGYIPPSVFVPLAEESGLILDLGEFVFRRVLSETRDWQRVRVAINVSAVQLRSRSFAEMVGQVIEEFAADPAGYEIEITETALLGEDAVTSANIAYLKAMGFSIALDDFGTGYSSLSSLQRYAVDKIKIDRSFVNNLQASEESEALVDAIVKLGRALKLAIIAEGVETEAQRERLLACGCNDIQGYLVSKPLPATEIAPMIGATRPSAS